MFAPEQYHTIYFVFSPEQEPKIVPPGHFLLSVCANPNQVGERDGNIDPNIKANEPSGLGVKYTTRTSTAVSLASSYDNTSKMDIALPNNADVGIEGVVLKPIRVVHF